MDDATTAITPAQFAAAAGCSTHFVYDLIKSGELPAFRLGSRSLRIRRSDAEAYMSSSSDLTPAERIAQILDRDTIDFLSRLAEEAPPLSDEQRAAIRAAFQGDIA
jgi:excisionase family DNA binding protein